MKKLTKNDVDNITNWLFNNGRDVDIARYNCLFYGETKELVLNGVTLYENEDGGFGKGIEPDLQNPYSNVIATAMVFEYLQEAGYRYDAEDEFFKEIIDPCMKWLYNSAPSKDNRWTSIVVENNDFPCAEWWKYKSEQYSTMPFNPTPALIGQTMLFTSPNSKYYEKAEKLLVNVLKQYFTNNVSDKYSLHSFYLLFKALRDLEYTNDFIDECYQKWLQDINYSLTREKEKFSSASACLIFDIVNEDSLLQGLFKQEIEDNLDYIIESRTNTGLWVPNYRWGNDDSYYDLAVILWASHLAIKNLVILNNFGRLEENCFA